MNQFGICAKSGLHSQKLNDLDANTARPKMPSRALPDSVRNMLRLPNSGGGG
eukprot:CAMPEP_0173378084 /NCGR_PEP_ID=MMETSP1356-20130122/1299_1 /TAXON_ID=77927 ORGANISM="Hemiselmis virescens, Strain PCC157" /NCGR_SAMPLE_ID=MMETSP1356 /ASSEMBLY_ACC=CAM_ASM_000847 /LENGTH=51 /DNA_ID=CAMNT_0014331043 /DNA_START=141 /DNA_END=292 /DNA_ORIENTATION=-